MNRFKESQIGRRYIVDGVLGQVRVIGPNAIEVLGQQAEGPGTVVMFNDHAGRDVTLIQDGVSGPFRGDPRLHALVPSKSGVPSQEGRHTRYALDKRLAEYWCGVVAAIHVADLLRACRLPAHPLPVPHRAAKD